MTTADASQVALVTGASSGIGRAAAAALVEAGFEVVGTSRNTSGVARSRRVTFLDLDITSDESVSTARRARDRAVRADRRPGQQRGHRRSRGRRGELRRPGLSASSTSTSSASSG